MTGEKPLRLVENINEFAILSGEDGESVLARAYVEPFLAGAEWKAFSSESFKHEIGTFNNKKDALGAAYNYLRKQYECREIIDLTSRAQEGNLVAKAQ